MTDHNAEGGKKVETLIEPCNLCGLVPVECNASGIEIIPCQCITPPSVLADWTIYLSQWNLIQRRILEQRRKDFEAGYHGGWTDGWISMANSEGPDYTPRARFDEYLESEREERGKDGK